MSIAVIKRALPSAPGRQAFGFTLLEVLIALVVSSIGLLGIAKLMMTAAHSNDSAYLRSQATEMAYSILDNMRANRQAALLQGYDTNISAMAVNPGSCLVIAAPCLPEKLASYDVYRWKLRLATPAGVAPLGALPSGQGSVKTVTTATGTTATIIVQWDDAAAQSTFGATKVGDVAPVSIAVETVL